MDPGVRLLGQQNPIVYNLTNLPRLTMHPLLITLPSQRHLMKESRVKYLGKIEQFSPWER